MEEKKQKDHEISKNERQKFKEKILGKKVVSKKQENLKE